MPENEELRSHLHNLLGENAERQQPEFEGLVHDLTGLGSEASVEDVVDIVRGHFPAAGDQLFANNSDLDSILRGLGGGETGAEG